MNQIVCKSFEYLPDVPESLSDYKNLELIIQPELEFPRHKGKCDFCLKTLPQYHTPYNYRLKFLHPSCFFGAFTEDGEKKLHTLNILAKRGASIVFFIDPENDNSLINACCLLTESFKDCINEGMALTNVPFPVKKSDSGSKDWIWSCYWDERFPRRLDERQSEEFVKTICLDFHSYDSRFFWARATASNDEGVIAFNVQVGEGLIKVVPVPHRNTILITVKEFPVKFNLKDNLQRVKYDILYKEQTYSCGASGLSFLRLLTWYYASQGDNCFGFTISDKKYLDKVFVMNNGYSPDEIVWGCIFNTKHTSKDETKDTSKDGSFLTTLNNLMKLAIPDCEFKDEIRNAIYSRAKNKKRETQNEYFTEKLNNLKIKFSDTAYENFKSFTLSSTEQRDTDFANVLTTFKKNIYPLVKP